MKTYLGILGLWLCANGLHAQTRPAIEWANIAGGTFTMGSPASEVERVQDETQHPVTLDAFKMAKHAVTVGQFKAFIDATGYLTDADKNAGGMEGSAIFTGEKWVTQSGVNWECDATGKKRPITDSNHPVIHVSWNDASAFAAWMGCRLPTEAEWEYACRAATTTPFNTGDNLTTSQANYNGRYPYDHHELGETREGTLTVGCFRPNQWGLSDMHGNVWEWCADWYGDYPTTPQSNPKGPGIGSHRVVRGGCWFHGANDCRSARRGNGDPARNRNCDVGFRIASST